MPSPFPGMDPYLEDLEWEDFHVTFNTVVRELLAPEIRPRYFARIERRIYIEHALESDECIPSTQERRETYLVIRNVPSLEIVTIIETLSPANKRASSDGRTQYLAKRDEIMRSQTNLVELDLLRGGKRLPAMNAPAGDYYAIISRGSRRPRADVFAWTLRQAMPTITIPLRAEDAEVKLNLQQAFNTVFDRAFYSASIDYSSDLRLPLNEADAMWRQQSVLTPES